MEEILVAEEDTVEAREEEEVATVEVITEEIKAVALAKEEVLVRVDSREEVAAPTWDPPPT